MMITKWGIVVSRIRLFVAVLVVSVSCGVASAQTFVANLDASQVVASSSETGSAVATFEFDAAQESLSYSIAIFGLDLKPVAGDRTAFSDVTAIHIHNAFPGSQGPHVFNIFGMPSEDDAQMVVDFDSEMINGIFDDSDAIDPATGELFDQNSPFTTKLFSNFDDDLVGNQLYIAIHTAGQNGNIAIRGQILAVPEPSSVAVLFAVGMFGTCVRRRRCKSQPDA